MGQKKKYWKGLEEYNRSPGFEKNKDQEFAEKLPIGEVLSENNLNLKSSRRNFLKFMGFSISAATLAACSRSPVKKAIPYVNKPPEINPGRANYYASTCFATNEAIGVLVKTREGRPVKIEGNPADPRTHAGTSAVAQASVLSLYDDQRLRGPQKNQKDTEWAMVDSEISSKLKKISSRQGNIRILSNTINSPSTNKAIEKFTQKYPGTKHINYDPVSCYGILEANRKNFSRFSIPDYKFDQAKTIVSFGADFLGTWIAPVEHTRKYVASRKVDKLNDMSFHIQIESNLSLTGCNADLRRPIKPSQEGAAVISLYNKLAKKTGETPLPDPGLELAGNALELAAKELWKNREKSIVVSGSNDPGVQQIINKINSMLGNYGHTLDFQNESYQKQGNDKAMATLLKELNQNKVDALILFGSNPLYDHPQGSSIAKAFKKVDLKVSLNDRMDESATHFTYVCPDHHYLESWNDVQPKKNLYSLVQPCIRPVFNTRSAPESLLKWTGYNGSYYDFIRDHWKKELFPQQSQQVTFENFWRKSVHDGIFMIAKKNASESNGQADQPKEKTKYSHAGLRNESKRLIREANEAKGYEIVLYEKVGIRSGKEANNPWLQELPDPVTRTCWDNYACISPKLAGEKGLKDEDVIEIKAGNTKRSLPVLVQPGQAYGTIGIAVGFGRFLEKKHGKVAHLTGKNVFPYIQSQKPHLQYFQAGATFKSTGTTFPLAKTQTHHHMEGRDLIREASLNQYLKDPSSIESKSHHIISLYKEYNYGRGHHWAMAVDLNACTGCGACVISCQAENNVPVVGKEEVRRRREMHWIRIDRYYGGEDTENPTTNFQPVMCQHCDNAPCENVCPVAAIAHSNEGLNQQAYNRCVGTRYCANNCPYKVRRFNWFKYGENDNFDYNMNSDLGRLVLNPDVTVRSRGVMEKCSFCVQRIQKGKLNAKMENRKLKDKEVKPACQTACPADAIKFGDINNPESEISKMVHENKRSYTILTELGTRPSVHYMTKLRNQKQTKA